MPYKDMSEVIRANEKRGDNWFDVDTKRFFRSRIGRTLYGGRYFVTSEQFVAPMAGDDGPRRYSIREVMPDGAINTVGEFQAYTTRADAIRAIKDLLRTQGGGNSE